MKRPAYHDRLEAFAAQAPFFISARVVTGLKGWGRWERFVEEGEEPCACCGTQSVRTLYPVAPEGDALRLQWVGGNCLSALTGMGKVRPWNEDTLIRLVAIHETSIS